MIEPDYVRTMARYNRWQNQSLYLAADGLSDAERDLDRGAFFGSIRFTLTHVYWGDRIWMSRFTPTVEKPTSGSIPASVSEAKSWEELKSQRLKLDQAILDWADQATVDHLQGMLAWHSGALGRNVEKSIATCIVGFFNHQTHHRGQVHAMLTAAGAKPDDTDLFIMPESN